MKPGYAKLEQYLIERHAADLADGWVLDVIADRVLLIRGTAVKPVELPSHLRPVADAEAWHRERAAGAPTGLPLFAEREDATAQGVLF